MTNRERKGWFRRLFQRSPPNDPRSEEAQALDQKIAKLRKKKGKLKQSFLRTRVKKFAELVSQQVDYAEENKQSGESLHMLGVTVDQVLSTVVDFVTLQGSQISPAQEQRVINQLQNSLDALIGTYEAQIAARVEQHMESLADNLELLTELSALDGTPVRGKSFTSCRLEPGHRISLTEERPMMSEVTIGVSWYVGDYAGGAPFNVVPFCLPVMTLQNQSCDFFPEFERGTEGDDVMQCKVELTFVPSQVEKLVFGVTIESANQRNQNFSKVKALAYRVLDVTGEELYFYKDPGEFTVQTAVVGPILYRRRGEWRLTLQGTGFRDGVPGLKKAFQKGVFSNTILNLQ